MIKRLCGLFWIGAWFSISGPTLAEPAGARPETPGRAWTSLDSVAVRYFHGPIVISPGGQYFFFVSHHGELSCDCNVFDLSVFAIRDVRRALAEAGSRVSQPSQPPKPLRSLIRRSSDQVVTAIASPQWERDGQSISFVGLSDKGVRQLYRFTLSSGAVVALTDAPYGVQPTFGITRQADTIIYNSPTPTETPPDPAAYPMHAITRAELIRVLIPSETQTGITTFVSYRGGTPWPLKSDFVWAAGPWTSADGRKALMIRAPKEVSPTWAGYGGGSTWGALQSGSFAQFTMIDAEHGHSEAVFDAPAGTATKVGSERQAQILPEALWAEDGRHVVLVNTALPLTADSAVSERANMAYVVGYDTGTGQWDVIEALQGTSDGTSRTLRRATQVGWLKPGKELLIGHELIGPGTKGLPAPGTVYTLRSNQWVGHTVPATVRLPQGLPAKPPSLPGGLSVTLRQSANDPPAMVASDGHHELALTTPDPALDGIWRARMEPFQWREPDGEVVTGGLLLPRKSKTDPLPLVIQAYNYLPDQFSPDGPGLSAYAAQTLVAKGMAVLNVNIPGEDVPPETGTPRELTKFAERVDSAANALATQGLIDRNRVGLIGFSRAGYLVFYAITHPSKSPPAAAVIDDSYTGTFDSYLFGEVVGGGGSQAEQQYGGAFWQNKNSWLERETSFNVDRVETAALFTVHGSGGIVQTYPEIGAFALNQRPMEYLVFPKGDHALTRPRERLASLEASADWMAFWLQGYEDPSSDKAGQYVRWRAMRQQNDERRHASGSQLGHIPTQPAAP